jgi:hypothetical protein
MDSLYISILKMQSQRTNGSDTILKTFYGALKSNDLQPLSVVLFQGTDFISGTILGLESMVKDKSHLLRYGVWSHCGILITPDLMPNTPAMKDIQFAVMEMTCSGKMAGDPTPDLQTKKGRFGLQLRDFSSVMQTYKGKIAICKLADNPFYKRQDETDNEYFERKRELTSSIENFYNIHRNTRYQLNFLRLLASVIPSLRFLRRFFRVGANWKMCSDIVATFYKHIGVFGPEVITEDCIPQDFIKDEDEEIPIKTFIMPPIQILIHGTT